MGSAWSMPHMYWSRQWTYDNHYYFCLTDVTGYNSRQNIIFDVSSITQPVSHGPQLFIPVLTNTKSFEIPLSQTSEYSDVPRSGEILHPTNDPGPLKQQELYELDTQICCRIIQFV